MRYRWPDGKQSRGGALVRLRRGVGLLLPRAREGQAEPGRPRGAALRPAGGRGPHPAHDGSPQDARVLLHSRLDGGASPRAVQAHPGRRPRDRRPRQHARGGELPRRRAGREDHARPARHPEGRPRRGAQGLPLAVLGREHVDARHPQAPRLSLRHLPHGQRHPLRDRQRGGPPHRAAHPVAARRRARCSATSTAPPTPSPTPAACSRCGARSSRACTRRTARSSSPAIPS